MCVRLIKPEVLLNILIGKTIKSESEHLKSLEIIFNKIKLD